SLKQNGVTVSEAGIPASPPTIHARLFIDFRSDVPAGTGTIQINTGIAIANAGLQSANLTFVLRDSSGQTLASGTGTLAAGQHNASFIDQLQRIATGFTLPANFATSVHFGTLDVSADHAISVVALRLTVNQRGETLLTSTPVADVAHPSFPNV